MKKILILPVLCCSIGIMAQQKISGVVLDATTEKPLVGIRVGISQAKTTTFTDGEGRFVLSISGNNSKAVTLHLSGEEYNSREQSLQLPLQKPLVFIIECKRNTGSSTL